VVELVSLSDLLHIGQPVDVIGLTVFFAQKLWLDTVEVVTQGSFSYSNL
jgi:hypothetical protein